MLTNAKPINLYQPICNNISILILGKTPRGNKMKNIFKALSFVVLATLFAGCPKDDTVTAQPPKPYAEQKPIDEAAIDDFLVHIMLLWMLNITQHLL